MTIKITINNNVIDIKSELINIYNENETLIDFSICYTIMFLIMMPMIISEVIKPLITI